VYPEGDETDLEMLTAGKADALAGLRHVLEETAATLEGARVLDGHAVAIQQAIGVPKGREAAAAYLQQFVEDVKKSGFLTEALQRRGARGAAVAP
jgi:polar amino acid transport system substrate-binding protein